MTEDDMLNRITVEQLLNRLPPHHAELIRMIEKIDQPLDYTGPWPATYEDIGVFIGVKYEGRPLSEATVRYRRDACYRFLRQSTAMARESALLPPKSRLNLSYTLDNPND
jgi:hypothetical protein